MWELIDLLQKAVQYLALVCLLGPAIGSYVFRSQNIAEPPPIYGIVFGLLSIVLILLSPPQFAYRLGGLFDTSLYTLVLYGPVGVSLLLKLIGFVLLLISLRLSSNKAVLQITGGLILIAGFVLVGHVSASSYWLIVLLAIHILAACWWFGGLLYLRSAIDIMQPNQFHSLLVFFSQHAVKVVGLLVGLGIILSVVLLGLAPSDWNRNYLAYYIGKLTLVLILLGFAFYNKFVLTRDLANASTVKRTQLVTKRLKGAIEMEIVLFVTLLIVTAGVTSLASPTN